MGHAIHRIEHFEIVGPYTLAPRFDEPVSESISGPFSRVRCLRRCKT